EIAAKPASADAHLARVDHHLNLAWPAGRDLADAVEARGMPAELRMVHRMKQHAVAGCDGLRCRADHGAIDFGHRAERSVPRPKRDQMARRVFSDAVYGIP